MLNSKSRLGVMLAASLMGVSHVAQLVTRPFEDMPLMAPLNLRGRFSKAPAKPYKRKLHRPARAENVIARNQREALGRSRVVGKAARNKQAKQEARQSQVFRGRNA